MASTSRMWLRNLLPRPSPAAAPLTRPAMSTNSTAAGMMTWDDDLGFGNFGKRFEARIGNGDDADVGINGAEGIVRGHGFARAGHGVEKGRFSNVGQADNSSF